jgi:N utilization substance protein A
LIEKAVAGFTKIDGVDTNLAEKLVEQGILSYDDLSVMEIDDLVNTIEDLNEELAVEIVGRAEVLAEEQADEMPRRKGARPQQPAGPAPSSPVEAVSTESEISAESEPSTGPTLSDLFDDEGERSTEADPEANDDDEEFRDVALASEEAHLETSGHEVTSAPSDADQHESITIATDAAESISSPEELVANEAGEGATHPDPFLSSGTTGSASEPPDHDQTGREVERPSDHPGE